VKRFLPARQLHIDCYDATPGASRCIVAGQQATFLFDLKNETIITRRLESSVSHFIDCHSVALRLSISPGRLQADGQSSMRDSQA
jgi:hypothetical protein